MTTCGLPTQNSSDTELVRYTIMTLSSASAGNNLAIDEMALPGSVRRYFETVNAGEFEQTAALFAEDGQLVPPFDQPIVGRGAIAQFLKDEATGMEFTPLRYETDPDHLEGHLVRGKVKTSLFTVNVAWNFSLSQTHEITRVEIKLLATLNELLKLKS